MSRFIVDVDVDLSDVGNTTSVIHSNKDVHLGDTLKDVKVGAAKEIPPCGRLIDADKLVAHWHSDELRGGDYTAFHFIESVDRASTILEASE